MLVELVEALAVTVLIPLGASLLLTNCVFKVMDMVRYAGRKG
jgi:hypothetical protein